MIWRCVGVVLGCFNVVLGNSMAFYEGGGEGIKFWKALEREGVELSAKIHHAELCRIAFVLQISASALNTLPLQMASTRQRTSHEAYCPCI